MHCTSIPHLFGPNTLRRTACARCASLAIARHWGTGSTASVFSLGSSLHVPSLRPSLPQRPHAQKSSSASSIPVLLLKVRATWTSGRPRGSSLRCARHAGRIWVALVWPPRCVLIAGPEKAAKATVHVSSQEKTEWMPHVSKISAIRSAYRGSGSR